MGIASLVLGIIGFLVSFTLFQDLSLILSVLAVVLGIIAIVKKQSKGMAIAGVVLAVLGIIICFSTNSSSEESTGTGITNDKGKGSKVVSVSADKVKVEKLGLTKAGDLVVKVTNNNKGSVCLSSVTANFKDANGKFALKKESENTFIVIPGEESMLTYFWGYDENYSQYPEVEFNTELANISNDFASSGIELKSNNTGSQIAVTLKNDSGKTIKSSNVVVIYYQGNEIVGAQSGFDDSTVKNGNEAFINVDYPEDNDYNQVPFDKFEVYYVNASFNF